MCPGSCNIQRGVTQHHTYPPDSDVGIWVVSALELQISLGKHWKHLWCEPFCEWAEHASGLTRIFSEVVELPWEVMCPRAHF